MDAGDDALIERLRERAGDPLRRRDARPTRFDQEVGGMSAAELRLGVESAASALAGLVASIQSGAPIEPALHERARQVEADMSTPAEAALPAPSAAANLERVEAELGVPLPDFLRRLYRDVADGGFGPGAGLLAADQLLAAYRDLRSSPPSEAEGDEWPEELLPLVAVDDAHFCCLEAATGRVLETDHDEIESDDDVMFRLTLREVAPSLQAWFAGWLDAAPASPPPAARLQDSMVEAARASRARIAAMTPAQRAALGLPEHGWEQVVWGGIGLEPDQTA
jgi:SMI1 / KNR4 family (SUKH-1)